MKMYSTLTMLLLMMLSACSTPGDQYHWVTSQTHDCSRADFNIPGRICVRPHLLGSTSGGQAGNVPVSAIVEGIVRNTSLDASAPEFDNTVNGIAQGLKKRGYVEVWIAYQYPHTFGAAFVNDATNKQLQIFVVSGDVSRTKYLINY